MTEQAHALTSPGFPPGYPAPGEPTPFPTDEERTARLRAAGIPEEFHEWMGPHGVSPLGARMGLRFREMHPDKLVATIPVGGNEQNVGILHGGAHMVLAETLGSIATILHVRMNLGVERNIVGTELGATHHRAGTSGLVWGTCTPLNLGKQLTSHEIVMRDDQGRRLSTARMTNMILQPR
ncbi:hotdog fold thioesterase [Nesterenkonia flava]|uniref:Hotdog fold thioesterase n=1 Tax=Nesterenkonia flava TaxID=469799 RepID=A0ABU1FUN9_9MICC|nr:hotdog fold thioesterase [Nesterenkonia flava]MDR5712067.1 hotdog fold thioesterase [Nesterenkonia flava]